MAASKKNMLEAFRRAGDPDVLADGPDPAVSGAPAASGAPGDPVPVEPTEATSPPTPESLFAPPPPSLMSWLPVAAAVGLAFVVGILVGRASVGEVAAAEPAETLAPGGTGVQGAPRAAGLVPAESRPAPRVETPPTAADPTRPGPGRPGSALFDPANQYTVVVATYARTQEDLAWATHDHLHDVRLPVFPPIEVGENIVILVGAAPTYGALADAESRIKSLPRDGVARIYDDAYRQRIDHLIER